MVVVIRKITPHAADHHAIQDGTHDPDVHLFQMLAKAVQMRPVVDPHPHHKNHTIRHGAQHTRVGNKKHRRGVDNYPVIKGSGFLDQRCHGGRSDQFAGVWAVRTTRYHMQVGDRPRRQLHLAQGLFQRCVSHQDRGQAGLPFKVKEVMHGWTMKIRVNQQGALSAQCHGNREVAGRRGFPLARTAGSEDQHLGMPGRDGIEQAGPDRTIGLGNGGKWFGGGQYPHRRPFRRYALHKGNKPKQRNPQFFAKIFRGLDCVIKMFQYKAQGKTQYQPEKCRHGRHAAAVRADRRLGQQRLLHNLHVGPHETGGHIDLHHAGHQRIVDLALPIHLGL